jgi:Bacterial dnaA protein helix-turn-helix
LASPIPLMAQNMIARAAAWAKTTPEILLDRNRRQSFVMARFAVMLRLRQKGWSYPRIARALGRKDHTTAIHGVAQARWLLSAYSEFAELLEALDKPCDGVAQTLKPITPALPVPGQFWTLIVTDAQLDAWRQMARAA